MFFPLCLGMAKYTPLQAIDDKSSNNNMSILLPLSLEIALYASIEAIIDPLWISSHLVHVPRPREEVVSVLVEWYGHDAVGEVEGLLHAVPVVDVDVDVEDAGEILKRDFIESQMDGKLLEENCYESDWRMRNGTHIYGQVKSSHNWITWP